MIPRRNRQTTRPRLLRHPLRLAAAGVAVALAAAACGGSSSGGGEVKEGGVFRLGSNSTIDSLNPFVAFNADAWSTFEYIYPELAQYNPKLQSVPDFARSWQQSNGGTVWTFHTQPNAKWSDGKPLRAADVAWTYSTILKYQNGATANSAGVVAHMKSATAPDAITVVLTYKQPVATVLSQVQQVPILPEHIWAKYATGNGKALTRFSNPAPIVSGGPFILDKYTPKQIALFKRNPSYYFDDFIINSNPKQDPSHKELLNPLLRQAFDAAIDRQAIVKTSLLGFGQPGSSILGPAIGHWYDPAIKPTPFDLAKANQLLDQAGYKMGPNGLRVANGHPMSYTVIVPDSMANSYQQRSFQIIQGDFKKIGVKLTEKTLDDSAAYDAILANNYKNFELSLWDWYPLPDPDFMLSVLTCGSWNVWNDTGYCSKTYDGMYQAQSAAIDPAKRQQIIYQMQQMVASQKMYLVLDYPDSIEAHSPAWTDLPLIGDNSFWSGSKIPMESVHRVG